MLVCLPVCHQVPVGYELVANVEGFLSSRFSEKLSVVCSLRSSTSIPLSASLAQMIYPFNEADGIS
eukprot:scaffold109855_cov50-Attheya_sp.AAC.2